MTWLNRMWDQVNGEDQITEQLGSPEFDSALGEEELAGVRGAGIGNAFKGWHAAADEEGNLIAKGKTALFGLMHSSKGSSSLTEAYAEMQAAKHRIKDAVRTYPPL